MTREQLITKLQADNARDLVEIAERHQTNFDFHADTLIRRAAQDRGFLFDPDFDSAGRPRGRAAAQPQQQAATMDAAISERWNIWLREAIVSHLKVFDARLAADHNMLIDDLEIEFRHTDSEFKKLRDEVTGLRDQIGQLTARLTLLESVMRGDVTLIKGRNDAAA